MDPIPNKYVFEDVIYDLHLVDENKKNAEDKKKALKKAGYKAEIVEFKDGKKMFYAVYRSL